MLTHLKYTFRNLRRNPLFMGVAVLSIALGIGVNTAIFSLLDQLLLRSLPAVKPADLVQLDLPGPRRGATFQARVMSYPMYRTIASQSRSFSGMWGQYLTEVSFAAKGSSQVVRATLVTGGYFEILGLRPAIGRTLSAADDEHRGGHPVAVLSHGFWKERFGGDAGVLQQNVLLNGHSYHVVGVAPEGWRGTDLANVSDVYVPMAMKNDMTPTWDGLDSSQFYFLHVFGRLADNVSAAQAKAEVDGILAPVLQNELAQMGPVSPSMRDRFLAKRVVLLPAAGGNLSGREQVSTVTWTLMALVGVVLLIACANVANLLLARGSGRKKEIAVRLAMGASRRQLMAQLMTESMVLALLGGVVGLMLSQWVLHGMLLLQVSPVRAEWDGRILLFTFLLTLFTGVLFGMVPALQTTKTAVAPTLKDQAGSTIQGSLWVRKALVVGQITLSLLLLAAAGLFTKSLFQLRQTDPGFLAERLMLFRVDPSQNGYDRTRAEQFHLQLQEELAQLGGVTSVSMGGSPLFGNSTSQSTIRVEGYTSTEGEDMNPRTVDVGPGFFGALGVPLRLGRDFNESDTRSAPKVAIVNQRFVDLYFKGRDPLGHKIGFLRTQVPDITVVGVVPNIKFATLREQAENFRMVYTPLTQAESVSEMSYLVRTQQDGTTAARDIRAIVRRLDPNLPLQGLRTLQEQMDASLTLERMISGLCAGFGLVATLLAAVGLYGMMAFHVARRTREIGIRMALGAQRATVVRMVLREVGWLVLIGVGLGIPAAYGMGRLVQSLLFGTNPADPVVLGGAVVLLAVTALGAGWLPARRAARVDPMVALRYE